MNAPHEPNDSRTRHATGSCSSTAEPAVSLFTFPANRVTQNWTVLPANRAELRRRWEDSHATGAALYFVALALLTAAALVERR